MVVVRIANSAVSASKEQHVTGEQEYVSLLNKKTCLCVCVCVCVEHRDIQSCSPLSHSSGGALRDFQIYY